MTGSQALKYFLFLVISVIFYLYCLSDLMRVYLHTFIGFTIDGDIIKSNIAF